MAGGTSANVSLRIDDAGVPTVIKIGAGPAEAQRRRHEAEVLTRLEGAPTVRLRAIVDRGDEVELELDHVPARSLDACPPFRLDELAALGLGLATATDELHRRGVVHLAIEPSHVLVPDPATPVLCGLADAEVAPRGETLDPTADDRALRGLLEQEVARGVAASVIDPADPRSRQFEHIVSPARQPPPATPAALTGSLEAFLSTATATAPGDVQPSPTIRATRRRTPWFGIAGGVVAAAVLGAAWLTRDGSGNDSATPTTATSTTSGETSTTTGESATVTQTSGGPGRSSTTVPSTSALSQAASCPRLEPGLGSADVDGDGCRESYVLDPGRIEVGGRAYGIGEDGDLLAVGDWDCDGVATPALVRPGTGSVFLFAAWPGAESALSAEPVTSVQGALSLATASDATGCDALVVETASGPVTVVDPVSSRG